ncbi:2-isopropylmalate synthase [Candidatus Micrarchaeota archaeon]|nr:2-isopropylmalate synthase [Candidatus Micrarchaeota archaeon]
MRKPQILDTTLRDGEQTPGVTFNPDQKSQIARELKRIGVPLIEAGSACNGPSEKEGIRRVCEEVGDHTMVASFARIKDQDIDDVVESGAGRVSLVCPASDRHIAVKFGLNRDDQQFHAKALAATLKSLEYALGKGLIVELLAEDASQADPDYLKWLSLAAQGTGAECFCVCDTLGCLMPSQTYALFEYLNDGLNRMLLSFHGHDDKGLATANTLEALRAGAGRLHATVNGLGERCGNCALEEVTLCLEDDYKIKTIDLTQIQELSRLVAGLSNVHLSKSKAVVGTFAFQHDAGIHHAALMKEIEMYEPYPPAIVGRQHSLSLGKLSGLGSIRIKLGEMGVSLEEEKIPLLLEMVRRMNEGGEIVSDADFLILLDRAKGNGMHKKVTLEEISVITGNRTTPAAVVHLRFNGDADLHFGAATGDGPVDAAISAVNNALGEHRANLVEYHVEAITGGSDAVVRLNVTVELNGKRLNSSAMGTDLFMVSVDAYLKAVNLLL